MAASSALVRCIASCLLALLRLSIAVALNGNCCGPSEYRNKSAEDDIIKPPGTEFAELLLSPADPLRSHYLLDSIHSFGPRKAPSLQSRGRGDAQAVMADTADHTAGFANVLWVSWQCHHGEWDADTQAVGRCTSA